MAFCPSCASANSDGARFCSHCGASLEATRPVEGERKLATLLFADVVRSTSLAEQMDPEDWAAVMNGAFGFMNATVSRYGGTVASLLGDGVLAFFGAPVAQEDHAERAVRSGLELLAAAEEYGRAIQRRHGLDFRLRVGINTGTAVLAVVGDRVKAEYTAMGDTANVAARLQSAAEPGTVLISGDTHRLVRGLFDVDPRGSLTVKGRQAPVETFAVVAARRSPGATRGVEGLRAPLVGRDRELGELRERLDALRRGVGSVVAILGEAGIGKSRLLAEAREGMRDGGDAVAWYEGRAISYGGSLAYHPWQQVGRQMIGAESTDAPAAVRSRLATFCEVHGVRQEMVPLLETMLAVDLAGTPVQPEDGAEGDLTQRIADAVMACIRAAIHGAGAPRPHVLVFDDLHWADRASLELMGHVGTLAMGEPLLVACLLRPDREAPSWPLLERLSGSTGASFTRIALEPLDPQRSSELLGHLLHIEGLPADVRSLILERTDGNPFFLEEVLRSLIDHGYVVRENGHWRAGRNMQGLTIPETLTGVLSARLDRLPDPTKRVAQTAAVLGRIFSYRALTTVSRAAPPPERIENVDPHLGTLTFEELVRERAREPEREYIFKHALTQEAAYGLLLRQRRRELHLRAGRALEELYPDRLEEMAALLARHFLEGGDPERAVDYSLRAAARSVRLFALLEAAEHYDRAYVTLEAMDPLPVPRVLDTILEWTVVRYKLNSYQGLIDRLLRGEELARGAGEQARLARILSWIALIHMVTGFPSRGEPYLVESQRLATDLGIDHLLLLPFFFATEALTDRDPRRAVEQFDQVIELARRNRMPEIEGHALASSAAALARLGEYERARERIREALAAAPSGGHRVKEADVHLIVAGAYYDLGDVERGLEHARLGAELARSENAFECACAGFYAVGMGELEQRELNRALASFGTSMDLGEQAGWGGWSGFQNRVHAGAAMAALQQGRPDAVQDLEKALANARADRDDYGAALASEALARALVDHDPLRAESHVQDAIAYYRAAGLVPYEARALDLVAAIEDRRHRPDAATATRDRAATLRSTLAPAGGAGAQASG
jgi:class 3 adenylate cyclase/tetratricopeptide (TPR) repeat protein